MRRIFITLLLAVTPTYPVQALERIKIANETMTGLQTQVTKAVGTDDTDTPLAPVLMEIHERIAVPAPKNPIIPPPLPVVRALVGSTQTRTQYLIRNKKGNLDKGVATTTTYDYLLEGGKHLTMTDKIAKAKDSRPNALAHPLESRTALRTKRIATFMAPIVNILGSVAQVFTAFHK
jgi:hypothetical protein